MASFSSNVDIHFCSPGWVPDELVSLSLEQIICLSKCLVHQGALCDRDTGKTCLGTADSQGLGECLGCA